MLDSKDVLNKIMTLPITQWNYKGENITTTHIGPMAQDFYNLFHTGGDSLAISTIDPAGVALIGIQELQKENETLKNTIDKQNDKLIEMEKEINDMKAMIKNNQQSASTIK